MHTTSEPTTNPILIGRTGFCAMVLAMETSRSISSKTRSACGSGAYPARKHYLSMPSRKQLYTKLISEAADVPETAG